MGYLNTKMKNHILFSYFNFSIWKISLIGATLTFDFEKSNNLNLGKLQKSYWDSFKKYLLVTICARHFMKSSWQNG